MTYKPEIHHRRSIRLRRYDYSQAGVYFVTICTQNRECLFGEIGDGAMRLNAAGRILQAVWDALPDHYAHVDLDAWVIMPNHVHGIIVLHPVGAGLKPAPAEPTIHGAGLKPAPTVTAVRHGLAEIVRAMKTFSSRRINESRQTPGAKLWQRNYWEHIVRNETELSRIREYIQNNPARWELDKLHPDQPQFGATGRAVGVGGVACGIGADRVGAGLKPAPTESREPCLVFGRPTPYTDEPETWMI